MTVMVSSSPTEFKKKNFEKKKMSSPHPDKEERIMPRTPKKEQNKIKGIIYLTPKKLFAEEPICPGAPKKKKKRVYLRRASN